MKILLVDPPGKNKGLNTGLAYISAILKDVHEVEVLDLNNVKIGLCGEPNPNMPIIEMESRILKAFYEFEPDIFGVSVKTFTSEISKQIFKLIRAQKPKIFTVAGGPHITLDCLKFIQETGIDFGIQGEGEYTFFELCNALEKNQDLKSIEGICFWEKGEVIHNRRRHTIKDLDNIPFPYYGRFSSVEANGGHLKEYPILSSRGCPYHCSYCSMPNIMGGNWRSHSPERVVKELEYAKRIYHIKSFTVVDDNFTLDLKRVEDICNKLILEKINLPWNSQNGIRADRIDDHIAKKMKQSGCHFVWIGIESVDEEVFKAIKKGEKLDDIKKGIEHLKGAGIRVGGFFIIGLPYSTKEADLKSVEFVRELGIEGWWFNFVPYPYTKAYDWVQAHSKILRSSNGVLQFGTNSIEPVFETEEYTAESRIKAYNEIHIKLNYFDRLVDPSLKQWDKWRRIFKIVRSYGQKKIFILLIFILKYNFKSILNKIKS